MATIAAALTFPGARIPVAQTVVAYCERDGTIICPHCHATRNKAARRITAAEFDSTINQYPIDNNEVACEICEEVF